MWPFSKTEKRSNNDNIVNPCPIPDKDDGTQALSNLLKQSNGGPMNLSAFFAGVNLISNSIALMKWLYKDNEDNLLYSAHYLWHLFDESKMTRFNMVKNVVTDILLYGNGFIYIERNKESGKPETLHYSPASQTTMYFNPLNNELFFLNPNYSTKWNNGDNYLHFYMSSRDGYQGIPIVDYAYKTIRLSSNTEKSALDYYSSGGQLFGLITTNNTNPQVGTRESQMKALRQSWDEARSQSNGTGTIFVPQDLKYTALSSSAKESALVESRLFNIQEISRWLNISPVLLGDLSHNYYGSIAESQAEFIIHTLSPYVVMVEEELTRKLIMPSKQNKEHVDLDQNSILATDIEKQANYYSTLVKNGILTINEARHNLGFANMDGADDLIIPFTDINSNKVNSEEQQNNENNE